MSEPDVSVIVPCGDARATLPALLAALGAQTLDPGRFEVLLAGSGLGDQDGARVVDAPVDSGPGLKRNLAAAEARGAVLAFTDADCVPEPDWLERGLAAFADDVGVVQGRTLPPPGQEPAPLTHWIVVNEDHGLYETCNIFYRRELFTSLGGFSERFYRRYGMPFGEDADLGWRARRSGARVRFEPTALVRHAVEEIDLRAHLRAQWLARGFPQLARDLPELREVFLYRRVFLSPRSARFAAAAAGLALARRFPPALALALPYARVLKRESRPGLAVLTDATLAAALFYGTVRARRPVI
jgi:glycosyltransferase involved in cell wall biosynthesis